MAPPPAAETLQTYADRFVLLAKNRFFGDGKSRRFFRFRWLPAFLEEPG
jgi:hypothetical protein